jgi:hypothetical protein
MALSMPTSWRYGSPGTMPPAAQPVIDPKHEEKYPERSVVAYDTKGEERSFTATGLNSGPPSGFRSI